jgi:undecaprenyl-diphosphatase
MTIYIIALCLVQGISEFLPVSSSAHLVLLGYFFKESATTLEWEVALHLGTLLSVIVYFWRDLWEMTKGFFSWIFSPMSTNYRENPYLKQAWYLIIATLPAIGSGYMVKQIGPEASTKLIGITAIIFGILLYLVDHFQKKSNENLSYAKAFAIGCAQVLAFIPGASRSGSCITAARAFGLGRVEATRFAFLLSIPTVLGAVTLTAYDAVKQGIVLDWQSLSVAISLTAIIGLAVIHGVLKFLEKYSFSVFMIYRVLLGILILLFV